MGATNCPETPRQKMISMMYLVYTAMLALNVSAEILQAFTTVGDSMEVTNKLLLSKTESAYQMFENAYKNNPGKVGPNWEKAQIIRKETKAMLDYLDNVKYDLVIFTDGTKGGRAVVKKMLDEKGFNAIQKRDNYNEPTRFFVGNSEDGSVGKAIEMRKKIEAYQAKMLSLCDDKFRPQLQKIQVDTKSMHKNATGQKLNWQMYNFYHTVILADMVILNKIKSEIENSEYDLVNSLYSAVSADDFKFDKVVAKVVPTSGTYIMQGGTYEAEVFVAAVDTKSQLRGEVSGGGRLQADSGMLKLKFGAGALGPQKYKGRVYVKKETGEMPYDFEGEYFVAAPSATISATLMNVFYIGADNPVTIAAPGVNSNDLTATISGSPGATIRKVKPGQYVVNVRTTGKPVIHVSAKIGNTQKTMGSMEYRAKQIPNMPVRIGALTGGKVDKQTLSANGILNVDKNGFEFPVKFDVVSFSVQFYTGGDYIPPIQVSGNRFTSEIISKINKMKRGQAVVIDDIRYRGPAGLKTAASINFKIK